MCYWQIHCQPRLTPPKSSACLWGQDITKFLSHSPGATARPPCELQTRHNRQGVFGMVKSPSDTSWWWAIGFSCSAVLHSPGKVLGKCFFSWYISLLTYFPLWIAVDAIWRSGVVLPTLLAAFRWWLWTCGQPRSAAAPCLICEKQKHCSCQS